MLQATREPSAAYSSTRSCARRPTLSRAKCASATRLHCCDPSSRTIGSCACRTIPVYLSSTLYAICLLSACACVCVCGILIARSLVCSFVGLETTDSVLRPGLCRDGQPLGPIVPHASQSTSSCSVLVVMQPLPSIAARTPSLGPELADSNRDGTSIGLTLLVVLSQGPRARTVDLLVPLLAARLYSSYCHALL